MPSRGQTQASQRYLDIYKQCVIAKAKGRDAYASSLSDTLLDIHGELTPTEQDFVKRQIEKEKTHA